MDNTVFVDVTDSTGKSRGDPGSGVLLSTNGFILTARHIIEQNRKEATDKIVVALKTPNGQRLNARFFGCTTTELSDACLLYVASLDIAAAGITKSFPLSCRMPRATEPLVVSGFPVKSSFVVVTGPVTSSDIGELNKMYMDVRVLPGMSGGPVVDRNGALIGIVYGYGKDMPLGMFTPLTEAANLIQQTGIPCALGTTANNENNTPVSVPQNTAPALPSKVYIQIANSEQRVAAKAAVAQLKTANIPVETGVENVGAKAPNAPQIRYFSDNDSGAAQAVQRVLDQGDKFALVKVASKNPPPGLVEVWYPRCDSVGPFCPNSPEQVASGNVDVESGGSTDNKSDVCKTHSTVVCVKPSHPNATLVPGTAQFVISERSGGVFIDGKPINADPIGTSNIGWFPQPDQNSPSQICVTAYARTSACETKVYLRGQLQAQEIRTTSP